VALVCGGNVTQSFLARLPHLAPRLGPVKALSFRVAGRVANRIGAGFAVPSYEPFGVCRLILISVPEPQLQSTLEGLLAAPMTWTAKSVVLCGSWRGSEALEDIHKLGASCGTLNPVFDRPDGWFLAEGGALAIRRIRELVGPPRTRVVTIGPEAKPLYLAAFTLLEGVLPPVLTAASETLRAAGLSNAQALSIVGTGADQAVRAHAKAGRKAWGGHLAADEREAILSQVKALQRKNPALARFFLRTAGGSLELSGQDSKWLEQPPPVRKTI
jgi:predicted short-subunit dehydrogenase-like oxidoreductase (DUF2520 family)